MPIKVGEHEDGFDMRISDDGEFQSDRGGTAFVTCDPATIGEVLRRSKGICGELITAFRLPLTNGKSVVVRRIAYPDPPKPYFDLDKLQARLDSDLEAKRHCIR